MKQATNHISAILSSLNRENFNQFIFLIWQADNKNSDKDYVSLKKKTRIGHGVIEQHFIHKTKSSNAKSYQGFNLIVPFFHPLEVFLHSKDTNILLNREKTIIKKFSQSLERRIKNWYWPQDGEFSSSSIYFVSNLIGLSEETYRHRILPKFSAIVEPKIYLNEIGIGTYDSFIKLVPQKTEAALKKLISNHKPETSFFYKDGKIFVEQHLPDNFLQSGVLKSSLDACETVINFTSKTNSEIIKEFEHLLNRKFNETELETFLKTYYRVIFGNQYTQIETQLWLRFPELDLSNKERRIDIFLRNAIERDWELIELKGNGKIVTNLKDTPTLSSRIIKGISQLRNYERILQQDRVKKKLHGQGIEYYEPQIRLVIGGQPEVSIEQWRRIKNEHEKGLKISTHKDILNEMKARLVGVESIIES